MANNESVETTPGDLIAALTEEVEALDEREEKHLHILVACILSDLLGSVQRSNRWH